MAHNDSVHSGPWEASVTPIAPPTSANPRLRELAYAGLVTGLWSGLLCLLIFAIARVAGVPFLLAVAGGQTPSLNLAWFEVLLIPLAVALTGALGSWLLLGRRHAQRIVYWAGTALAVVSLAGPINQPSSVPWTARIALMLMHLVTWFLVVPQLARIVGDSEPGASVEQSRRST